MQITSTQHLHWAKQRALQQLAPARPWLARQLQRLHFALVPMAEASVVISTWHGFVHDLGRHPDTRSHQAVYVGMTGLLDGRLRTVNQLRDFIRGTN